MVRSKHESFHSSRLGRLFRSIVLTSEVCNRSSETACAQTRAYPYPRPRFIQPAKWRIATFPAAFKSPRVPMLFSSAARGNRAFPPRANDVWGNQRASVIHPRNLILKCRILRAPRAGRESAPIRGLRVFPGNKHSWNLSFAVCIRYVSSFPPAKRAWRVCTFLSLSVSRYSLEPRCTLLVFLSFPRLSSFVMFVSLRISPSTVAPSLDPHPALHQ